MLTSEISILNHFYGSNPEYEKIFITQNINEIKSGKATLKNLETGNESSVKIEDLANEIKKLL